MKIKLIQFLFIIMPLYAHSQSYYIRGVSSTCGWANTDPSCQLMGSPLSINLSGLTAGECKIYNDNGIWYPAANNAWHNGGSVTFRWISNEFYAFEASNPNICAPGDFSGWNNSTAMVNTSGTTWCYTITTPGTYQWKPTLCGTWYSWVSSDGERDVNAGNWSVTTTLANQQVCVEYDAMTGRVGMQTVMPVSWGKVTAETRGNDVLISWSTFSEQNNAYFSIETSADGYSFTSIGVVKGSGDSREVLDYAFIHEGGGSKRRYYRIQQVDFDGRTDYSPIVFNRQNVVGFAILPNPGRDIFRFISDQHLSQAMLTIYDVTGRLWHQTDFSDDITLDLSHLKAGVYLCVLTTNSESSIQKLYITK